MSEMTSRERMLSALDLRKPDHVPCCFISFSVLRERHMGDRYKTTLAQLEMGLDAMLFIPKAARQDRPEHPDLRGLPIHFHPLVETREWREEVAGAADILHKEYVTPDGTLTTAVRLSDDWPHGDHIPFIDDYQIPRSLKPLLTKWRELEALQYLLLPPQTHDTAAYLDEAEKAQAFARDHGVLLAGGWGVGMDMANWLCGMENLMIQMIERPKFVDDLLEMIHFWNVQRMEVVLRGPVDLFIRRGWYEGCDFVTPSFWRSSIKPRLRAETELAHRRGAKFGYLCTSGTEPILDDIVDAGVDVLIGLDPVQGTHTDLTLIREKLGGRVCLWGGVSGAVAVEMGSEADVRAAVRRALSTLGPDGFILSPVDNLTVDAPKTWENVEIFIDEWRKSW